MDFSAEAFSMRALNVLTVPAFNDNYLWLIHDGQHAAVVDPGDAAPILAALKANQLTLTAILATHHHADHVGGVATLLESFDVPVYGPAHDRIAHVTVPLKEGDVVTLEQPGLRMRVIDVPGHTRGHIAYYAEEPRWLFCGDTLFAGGCGRLFEGTPAQMLSSLDKLAALPDDTKVYCAHEYTVSNLRFALAAEPDNAAIAERLKEEQIKRQQHIPTVPSTIGLEKKTNPFLRARESTVARNLQSQNKVHGNDTTAVFAALREWKNNF
ncbi:MAG TPA: hydroxyacylglutathione hydrolase [Oxalicibacterium sp.]|nr:hydroxyacylglutathione hydrolase [Oxalicibacterium sp.]